MYYQRKQEIIEAIKWTGDNLDSIKDFITNVYEINKDTGSIQIINDNNIVEIDLNDYVYKENEQYYCSVGDIFENMFEEYNPD